MKDFVSLMKISKKFYDFLFSLCYLEKLKMKLVYFVVGPVVSARHLQTDVENSFTLCRRCPEAD